jgi:hypothetical protein
MSRVISPVTGKPYGLAAVCRVWQLARSGVYRPLSAAPPLAAQRRGPLGAMSDEALTTAIRGVLAASPFHGEGHRKLWARLRHAGTRTSLRRVLRLMRQNNLLAPTRVGSPRGPRHHDGTIIPDTVDTMWGTDLRTTITGEGQAAVFVAVDHCSAECVGIHAHARATRFQALEPIRQGVRQHFGGFAKAIARGLAVRHDHTLAVHVGPLPEGTGLSRDREFTRLRAGTRRQWRRRAVHPYSQGEPAPGADLPDHRRAAAGAARVPGNLQQQLADQTPRVPQPGRISPAAPSTPCSGSVGFNPVSQKPRAVHNEVGQVVLGQPILQIRRQQKPLIAGKWGIPRHPRILLHLCPEMNPTGC